MKKGFKYFQGIIRNFTAFLFLILIVFSSLLSFGQSSYSDSLRMELKNKKHSDTTRLLIKADLAYSLYNIYPDTTINYALDILKQSNSLKFDKGKGRALWLLGMDKFYQGDYVEADDFLDQAIQNATAANDLRELGRIFNSLGDLAFEQSNVVTALDFFNKSIRFKERVGDNLALAIGYNNIASIFSLQGAYEKALKYNYITLKLRNDAPTDQGLSLVYNDIGLDHLYLHNYDSAYIYLKKGLKLSENLGEQWGSANLRRTMATYFLETKQLDSAWYFLEKTEEMAILTGSKDILAELLFLNAKYYNLIKDFESAREFSERAIIAGDEMGKTSLIKNGFDQLSRALEGLGDYKEAVHAYKKFHIIEDSVSSARNQQVALTLEYEKEMQKQKLESEKEKASLQGSLERQKYLTWGAVFLIGGALIIIVLLYKNYKDKKLKNAELLNKQTVIEEKNTQIEDQNKQLQKQKQEIVAVNEGLEERIRERTNELAESVQSLAEQNQNLEQFSYIVSNNLKGAVTRIVGLANVFHLKKEEPISEEMIDGIYTSANALDSVIDDLTKIIKVKSVELDKIDKIDLDDILKSTTDFFQSELNEVGGRININLADNDNIHSVKSFIHSISLNLISNAIKFRAARRDLLLDITGRVDGDLYALSFSDNGMGIDLSMGNDMKIFKLYQKFHSNELGRGFGLYFVKTQIEALKGHVEVTSNVGQGTVFTIYFPYKK